MDYGVWRTPPRFWHFRPGPEDLDIGVVEIHPAGSDHGEEVRAVCPKDGATVEDPVTGSLNASAANVVA